MTNPFLNPDGSLNRQQIINAVYSGARSQDFRYSGDEDGACFYHAPNGDRCHLGHIMAALNVDSKALEDRTFTDPLVQEALGFDSLPEDDYHFLVWLQDAHDYSEGTTRDALEAFILNHNLEIPNV